MSDRSPSLIATEVATTEVMSDEAIAVDDDAGHGAGHIDLGQDGATVPALNAQPLTAPNLASVFNPSNMSPFVSAPTLNFTQDYRTLFQQHVQIGESADQARAAVSQAETEAERRHKAHAQQQAYLAGMEIQHLEAQAERAHDERMSECKAELKQASQREKFLLHELAACRTEMQSMEVSFQHRHMSEMTRLRTTLIEEGEAYKNEALDYLGLEFKAVLAKTESSMNENFAIEVAEMSEQNDRLQDELAAAERSLRMESEARGSNEGNKAAPREQAAPQEPAPQPRVAFSHPFEIPESLRHLFPNRRTEPTTPPGFEGIPKNRNEKASGVPPAETNAQSELNAAMLLQAAANLSNKSETEEGKPKVKEAETIKLPDFPSPETYRSWRTSVREIIRAASDRPDEAFAWVQEVYKKGTTMESLYETGKFVTLDTKLLAALGKVQKGEVHRQVLNYKETEAAADRPVRGRQVLWMFHQHFKTNEEVGSLYSVEDLLKVTLVGDDLSTFLYNFESVIAGMNHVPDEVTLRDILLRQLRKSHSIKYDLQIFDRAKEGTPTHTYAFLVNAVKEHLTRERTRRNRDLIAKSHGAKFGAPAYETQRPSQRGGRGRSMSPSSSRSRASSLKNSRSPRRTPSPKTQLCHDFQKGKCTRGDKCKYLHKTKSRSPGRSPGRAPSAGRTPAKKINATCMFWRKGKCNKGSECRFLHEEKNKPSNAAPSEQAVPASSGEKPRSPTPDPSTRRKPKSRGRSTSKDRSSGRAAACCISYAAAAAPNGGEGHVQRWRVVKKLRFKETPTIREIPIEGKGFKHRTKPRAYEVCYLDAESCPPPNPQDLKKAIKSANQLASVISAMLNGVECDCGYMCGDESDGEEDPAPVAILRCEHCSVEERNACLGFNAGLEFLADTGSEEDLISKRDHAAYYAGVPVENATRPVNLITANGSVQGNKAININLPELGQSVECYLLESTPPVCSVGRRCLDEDYEFHWPRRKAPYFITPEGKKIQCKLKGRVPIISNEETVASPASLDTSGRSAGTQVFNAGSAKVELATPAEDPSPGFQ